MAVMNVLHFPDERLRTVASPVDQINDEVRKIVDDMFETMHAEKGIGLAATQVNIHKQIIVMDVASEGSEPRVFINPRIIERDGVQVYEEGCLSVPGNYAAVERAAHIVVEALDRDGKPFRLEAEGLLAVCIQHEMDHLQGKLFVDYLSPLKRQRIRQKLEKAERDKTR
ncbi:MAG: peptide deformylase [Gammaproteobacteria bacterium]|nr:peptide deformylase [Gammaproteobacteria bacterium]